MNDVDSVPPNSSGMSVRKKFKPLILSSSSEDDEDTPSINKRLFKTPSSWNKCHADRGPIHSKKITPSSTSASPKSSSDSEDFGSVNKRKPLRPIQQSSTDCSDTDGRSTHTPLNNHLFQSPLKSVHKEKRDKNVERTPCSRKKLPLSKNVAMSCGEDVVQHSKDVGQLEKLIGRSLKLSDSKVLSEFKVSRNILNSPKENYFTPKKTIITQGEVNAGSTGSNVNSVKRMGKVTPYTFSGRKLKPVLLVSDEETSSDEDNNPVTPVARKLCGNSCDRSMPKFSFLKSLSPTTPAMQANPTALKFRDNFSGTKVELAQYLYRLFNEKVFCNKLPRDMALIWNGSLISTAGYCKTVRKDGVTTCDIHLSTKVLTTADRLRDTLLHEMCHAAVRLISRLKEVHGPMWNTWAIRCTIAFPDVKVPKRCHNYDISYKYSYRCTNCGKKYNRHRQSIDVTKHKCGKCHGTLKLSA